LSLPIKVSISYDITLFMATAMLGQSVFIYFYLGDYVPFVFRILYAVLAVVLTVGIILFRQFSNYPLPKGRIIVNALWIFIVYTYASFLYPHGKIMVNYIVNTLILLVFFNVKIYLVDALEKLGIDEGRADWRHILVFISIPVTIIVVLLFNVTSMVQVTSIDALYEEEVQKIDIHTDHELFLDNGFGYVSSENLFRLGNQYYLSDFSFQKLGIYNLDFQVQDLLDISAYEFESLYVSDGVLYAIRYNDTISDVLFKENYKQLYQLNDQNEFVWVLDYYAPSFSEPALLEGNYITYEFYDYYFNSKGNFISVHSGDSEYINYKADAFFDNEIIYQDDEQVIYTKNGYLSKDFSYGYTTNYFQSAAYSNGYMLLYDTVEKGYMIYDFPTYLNGGDPVLFIDAKEFHPSPLVTIFVATDSRFLINNSNFTYFVNAEGAITDVFYGDASVYMDDNITIYTTFDDATRTYTHLVLDQTTPTTITSHGVYQFSGLYFLGLGLLYVGVGSSDKYRFFYWR